MRRAPRPQARRLRARVAPAMIAAAALAAAAPAGAHAVGAFIDTRIEPAGWTCAHVDRRVAGHDFACTEIARPGRRVIARRVREV